MIPKEIEKVLQSHPGVIRQQPRPLAQGNAQRPADETVDENSHRRQGGLRWDQAFDFALQSLGLDGAVPPSEQRSKNGVSSDAPQSAPCAAMTALSPSGR